MKRIVAWGHEYKGDIVAVSTVSRSEYFNIPLVRLIEEIRITNPLSINPCPEEEAPLCYLEG